MSPSQSYQAAQQNGTAGLLQQGPVDYGGLTPYQAEKEIQKFGLLAWHRLLFKIEQQSFPFSINKLTLFRRFNGIRCLRVWALILLCIGFMILIFGGRTDEILIHEYSIGDPDVYRFELATDQTGPFHVYARISNFRVNFRRTAQSRPSEYFEQMSCGIYDTIGSALYIRPAESFPEVAGRADTDLFFPCGVMSATIFNDQVSLEHSDANEIYKISDTAAAPRESFLAFTNELSDEKKTLNWTSALDDRRYRGWMYSAFLPSFNVYLGVLEEYVLPRGDYNLKFDKNLWPDATFNAQKSIAIVKFGLLGSPQRALGYFSMAYALVMFGLSFALAVAVKKNYTLSSGIYRELMDVRSRAAWTEHIRQYMQKQQEQNWRNAGTLRIEEQISDATELSTQSSDEEGTSENKLD